MDDPVRRGRAAFDRGAWADAHAALGAAEADLAPGDLHRLGVAAYLTGHADEAEAAMAAAHRSWHERGDPRRAAREAFWIGLMHVDRGALAPAGGWFARGQRLVEDLGECAEQGLFLVPEALGHLVSGEQGRAREGFGAAAALGQRLGDDDLCALARLGEGQALVATDRVEEGLRLLDEVMVGVVAEVLSPLVTGLVYCAVIETCQQVLDLRRSAEWTTSLGRWCDAHPELVSHRGRCLVHRAEVLRYRGDWDDAVEELGRARSVLDGVHQPALGAALYQLGELHRLRGEVGAAEEAYREASRMGHDVRPGLPRLRLQQGRHDDAWAALAGGDGPADPGRAVEVLAATVDAGLASGHVAEARDAADRLDAEARRLGTDYLAGLAGYCRGRVLLAGGDAPAACGALRAAIDTWQRSSVPLEEALARAAFGRARRAIGDGDTADLELDAARRVLRSLGARPDLEALGDEPGGRAGGGPLTGREVEVLGLAARGMTNREIADTLVISPHTVRRHLQNVFTKLGVSTRSAAASAAREHGLIR